MELKRGDIVYFDTKKIKALNLGKNIQDLERPHIILSNNINNKY